MLRIILIGFLSTVVAFPAGGLITLNQDQYFEGPGFLFLVFHNNYQQGGYQSGLQLIQNGERLLDSGDVFVAPRGGEQRPAGRPLSRVADVKQSAVTAGGELRNLNLTYGLTCRTDGSRIFIALKLNRPIDWTKVEQAGFRIFLYPPAYSGKSFQGDALSGVFPQQYSGRRVLLDNTAAVRLAQEDPLRSVTITRRGGNLQVIDDRIRSGQTWFSVAASFTPGSQETELRLEIEPSIRPEWRRTPVIGISQAGYHPKQTKRAVLELDPRSVADGVVTLLRLRPNAQPQPVKQAPPKPWGRFLRLRYATFDFSEIREPGVYVMEYKGRRTASFRIAPDVLDFAWRPTLEYFLPVQMCHVQVREGPHDGGGFERVWHGACHLDDALQAPARFEHIDGYRQEERETPFVGKERIPGLNWGGWHDAGDEDLPSGSIAQTVLSLSLAHEEFAPKMDQTTIRREERLVLLHQPDGRPDLLQQIEYGVEGILGGFRAAGHVFPGIIGSRSVYLILGDTVNGTDNLLYDAGLKPGERNGERSGNFDDRWAFTNRQTGLQYDSAQALAAASRALRSNNPKLAGECLAAALKIWEFEQSHPPAFGRQAYASGDSGYRAQEIAATTELLLTTGDGKFRERLLGLLPVIRSISGPRFGRGPGWVLARALAAVNDEGFRTTVRELAGKWTQEASRLEKSNPYRVRYRDSVVNPPRGLNSRGGADVYGEAWELQREAFRQYYFHKAFPDLFGIDPVLDTVSFVLGCHPGTDQSYVSGVGARSAIVAFGFNRADWSYIPGGIISGASLIRPDFIELKEFPWLWYQSEYVIHAAGTYVFDVLAAQKLLGD